MSHLTNSQTKYYLIFPVIIFLFAFWLILSPSSHAQSDQEIINHPFTTTSSFLETTSIAPMVEGEEELKVDDGTIDGRGILSDGLVMVNRLTPSSYPVTLKSIRIYFVGFQGQPSPIGRSIRLIAFKDPASTGVPTTSPTFLVNSITTIPSLGAFVDFPISPPVEITSGDIYVGYQSPTPASGVGFAADTNGIARRRTYFSTDNGYTFKGPMLFTDGTEANMMIRALVSHNTQQTGDFSLTISPLAQQVSAGKQAQFTINTTAIANFTGTISLTSTTTPPTSNINVAFSLASLRVGESSTMTVTTLGNTPTGNYQITVTGTSGVQKHIEMVNLTVIEENLPTISVKASTPLAYEEKSIPGVFTITRTGDLSKALTVNYQLSGTASNQDFMAIAPEVVMLAGQASSNISIIPIDDTATEGDETLNLTLTDHPTYKLGPQFQDTIKIVDNDNWEKLISTTVDKKGGTVTAGGLAITIPKKTFKTATNIEVYQGIGVSAMDEARVSEVYRIIGLPQALYKAVTLSLETKNDSKVAKPFIVIATKTFIPSLGKSEVVPQTIAAIEETGHIRAVLPFSPKTTSQSLIEPMEDKTANEPNPLSEAGEGEMSELYAARLVEKTSTSGKFIIRFHAKPGSFLENTASEILKDADQAYSALEGYGVSFSKRTNPIVIDLSETTSTPKRVGETTGGFLGKFFGPNYYSILFNANEGLDPTIRKATISHELCHVAQALYDTRGYFAMATSIDQWFWLEESICTWFEWKMTDTSKVPSNVADDKYNFLLHHGLYFPPSTSSEEETTLIQNHGYGSSMFLSYITLNAPKEELGNSGIATLIKSRSIKGRHPIDSIKQLILTANDGQLSPIWQNFCKDWFGGNIYSSQFPTAGEILGNSNHQIVLDSPTQGGVVTEFTSTNLSATLFKITFKKTLNWAANTKIKFTLKGGNNVNAYIAEYIDKNSPLNLVGEFNSSFEIANAEKYVTDSNQQILILVTDGQAVSPYTGTSTIELALDIDQPYARLYQHTRSARFYNEYLQGNVSFTLEGDHKVLKDISFPTNTQEMHLLEVQMPKLNNDRDQRTYTVKVSVSNLKSTGKINIKNPVIKEMVFRVVDSSNPTGVEKKLSRVSSMETTLMFNKSFTKAGAFEIYAVFVDLETLPNGQENLYNIGSSTLEGVTFIFEK